MSKTTKLVDFHKNPADHDQPCDSFDWTECVICQERTHEDVQCPADTKRTDVDIGAGYHSFASIILRCSALNWFPLTLNLQQLDDGNGIASTFQSHTAKWHKSCRLFSSSDFKISRQEKRKQISDIVSDPQMEHNSSKITRRSCGESSKTMTVGCFFCGDVSGDLHEASTFMIDRRIRESALELQDTVLLAKLSVGDLI